MNQHYRKNKTGVYRIHCTGNKRDYIGSAVKHLARWNSHRSMLSKGTHNNRHLKNAYKKYGRRSFIYTLIEECTKTELTEREQYWIDRYDFKELMNSSPTACTSSGFKHSSETKEIIKQKAKKRKKEHLKKYYFKKGCVPSFKGKKHSKETIEKLKKIAASRTHKTGGHNKGVPMPDAVKRRVSESVSKNRRVYGDEVEIKAQELRKNGWVFKKISDALGVSLAQAHRMSNGHRSSHQLKYQVREYK
ncbi:MAG: GIY-YIG nuclease family protein [Paracoccaceae bacterium]